MQHDEDLAAFDRHDEQPDRPVGAESQPHIGDPGNRAEGQILTAGPDIELGRRKATHPDGLPGVHGDAWPACEPCRQVARRIDQGAGVGRIVDLVNPHDMHFDPWLAELEVHPAREVGIDTAAAGEARSAVMLDLAVDGEGESGVEGGRPRPGIDEAFLRELERDRRRRGR